jgi:hypothetical protein
VVELADEFAHVLRIAMFCLGIATLPSLKGTPALRPIQTPAGDRP